MIVMITIMNTRTLCMLLVAMLLAQSPLLSQYTVTKVVGHVKNKATDEQLRPGTKLKDDDILVFSTSLDMVRVIVSGKGIFVISPTPRPENSTNMLVEMLKSALKVKSREGYLSGRSEESDLVPDAWQTESAVNRHIHVGPANQYPFDTKQYPVGNGNRFFVQLDISAGKQEIHALQTSGDTLLLSAADLMLRQQVEGKVTYTIGFFNKEKNSSESLAALLTYIDTTGEMESIIDVIVKSNPPAKADELKKMCYAEVYEALGKPAAITFNAAFARITAAVAHIKR